jgi:vancomycin resistance protein YoaR
MAAYLKPSSDKMSGGVRFAGKDWSNVAISEARTQLEEWAKTAEAERVTLAAPAEARVDLKAKPTLDEVGVKLDVEATLAEAQKVGDDQSTMDRLRSWFSGTKQVDIAPKWTVDEKKSMRYLKANVTPKLKRPKRDAKLVFEGGYRKTIPEQPGATLDLAKSVSILKEKAPGSGGAPVELAMRVVMPRITSEHLKLIKGEIAHYKTHFSERGNRATNIITACSKINGLVLLPGDKFSYNDTVGPREQENGFRLAPVIIGGRLRPGMGGGICQVSTTLYNAALLSDLKIVRRDHHAFPVHYTPPGRDATVAYGSIDFQFQNNTDSPIAIFSSGANQHVEMRIYGNPVDGKSVEIERTNLSSWGTGAKQVKDSSLPAGKTKTIEKAHAGHKVTVWRTVKQNGQQVRREVVSHDTYNAVPAIIAVGTGAAPAPKSNGVKPAPVQNGAPPIQTPPPAIQ